jgi:hypothetical protein
MTRSAGASRLTGGSGDTSVTVVPRRGVGRVRPHTTVPAYVGLVTMAPTCVFDHNV